MGRETLGEVRDGLRDNRGVPGRVEGRSGRSEWVGDSWVGLVRIGGPSRGPGQV